MVVIDISDPFHFTFILQNVTLEKDETAASFAVNYLHKACLDSLHSTLIGGTGLGHRCLLNSNDITTVIELCHDSTFFIFNNVLFRQTDNAAMGSPVPPIVANLILHSS